MNRGSWLLRLALPCVLASVSAFLLLLREASAQLTALDQASALFEEGRKLADSGDYKSACPKFEESYRVSPFAGTLLNIAVCHEKTGKLVAALREFKLAKSRAVTDARPDRERLASEHIAELENRIARLTVHLPADVVNAHVAIDGVLISSEALNTTPLPLDPGVHVVEAHATERIPLKLTIAVGEAETRVLDIKLEKVAAPLPSSPAPHSDATKSGRTQHDVSAGSFRRTGGFLMLGVGAAAVLVGAGFGVAALGQADEAESLCPDPSKCPSSSAAAGAQDANDSAVTLARVADACFAVGIVSAFAGTYLLLTTKSPDRSASRVLISPLGIRIQRTF